MSWRWVSTSEKPEYWKWVADRAKATWEPHSKGLVAIRDDGVIGGGVLADNWTYTSCCTHVAIEHPMCIKAGFLHEVTRFLYDFCERKVLIGLTPGDNEVALRFNRHIGFQEVCRIPNGWMDGIDFVVQTMTPDQCRYYRRPSDG